MWRWNRRAEFRVRLVDPHDLDRKFGCPGKETVDMAVTQSGHGEPQRDGSGKGGQETLRDQECNGYGISSVQHLELSSIGLFD